MTVTLFSNSTNFVEANNTIINLMILKSPIVLTKQYIRLGRGFNARLCFKESRHKKWSFSLKIYSVIMIISAVSYGFGHIY